MNDLSQDKIKSTNGWVKLTDPKTNRVFYANTITRKTQWDIPEELIDEEETQQSYKSISPPLSSLQSSSHQIDMSLDERVAHSKPADVNLNKEMNGTMKNGVELKSSSSIKDEKDEIPLPPHWERKFDPKSQRYFYVDHVNRVTTWKHPSSLSSSNGNKSIEPKHSDFDRATKDLDRKSVKAFSSRDSSQQYHHSANQQFSTANSEQTSSHFASTPVPLPITKQYDNQDKSTEYYTQSLPHINFITIKIPDHLRSSCPSCHVIFSVPLKRRHHCRSCGDVFCDACSSHRVILPYEHCFTTNTKDNGLNRSNETSEDDDSSTKPVRVCNLCFLDVQRGNYFSMRRYITPLQLYSFSQSNNTTTTHKMNGYLDDSEHSLPVTTTTTITLEHVSAALSALSQDLESVILLDSSQLSADSSTLSDKVVIPPHMLISSITKFLHLEETADRAILSLSNLLALGNLSGDITFSQHIYDQPDAKSVWNTLMTFLEASTISSDTSLRTLKTLALQEQSARALSYLTDSKTIQSLLSLETSYVKQRIVESGQLTNLIWECLDVHRLLLSFLDLCTVSSSHSLSNWAVLCIRNLITEDYRRSLLLITDSSSLPSHAKEYTSFITTQLVSCGGIVILCSLIGSDDAGIRVIAIETLQIVIRASRDLEQKRNIPNPNITNITEGGNLDQPCIQAILDSGALEVSLSHFLLSADNNLVSMGCRFAACLVSPLVTNPRASEIPIYYRLYPATNSYNDGDDALLIYYKLCMALATNHGIMAGLTHLIQGNQRSQSIELKRDAALTMAAITLSISFWSFDFYSSEDYTMKTKLTEQISIALNILEELKLPQLALNIYRSNSIMSINTSLDSPTSQLREALCITIGSLSNLSNEMSIIFITNRITTQLIEDARDDGTSSSSSLRGGCVSRRLASLEALTCLTIKGWKLSQTVGKDGVSRIIIDLFNELLDGGIITLLDKLLKMTLLENISMVKLSEIRVIIACSHLIAALFGMSWCKQSSPVSSRLHQTSHSLDNVPATPHDIMMKYVTKILFNTLSYVHYYDSNENGHLYSKLLISQLLAAGSLCGSNLCVFRPILSDYDMYPETDHFILEDESAKSYTIPLNNSCSLICDALIRVSDLSVNSLLIGAYGEASIMASLRLFKALANYGEIEVHKRLAERNIIVSITDILRDALTNSDNYVFSAALDIIYSCGPHFSSHVQENKAAHSLEECVKILSQIVATEKPTDIKSSSKLKWLDSIQNKCIGTIERLSTNSFLWNTIAVCFTPCICKYITFHYDTVECSKQESFTAALTAIKRVVTLPSQALVVTKAGIGSSLYLLLETNDHIRHKEKQLKVDDCDVRILTLDVLQLLTSHTESRILLMQGQITRTLSSVTVKYHQKFSSDNSSDHIYTTILERTLEILSTLLDQPDLVNSNEFQHSVSTVLRKTIFIKILVATMLQYFRDIAEEDASDVICDREPTDSFFLNIFHGKSLDTKNAFILSKVTSIMICLVSYSVHIKNEASGFIWDELCVKEDVSGYDTSKRYLSTFYSCSTIIDLLTNSTDNHHSLKLIQSSWYKETIFPMIVKRLLQEIKTSLQSLLFVDSISQESLDTLSLTLKNFNLIQRCLAFSKNIILIDDSFWVMDILVSKIPDCTLPLICFDRSSLVTLIDVIGDNTEHVVKHKKFWKLSLFVLAEAGGRYLLGQSLKNFGLRSSAIASLSASFIVSDQAHTEDKVPLSSLSVKALVGIFLDETFPRKDAPQQILQMSSDEAKALSTVLGSKLSTSIVDTYLRHSEHEESSQNLDSPNGFSAEAEILLLCSLASMKSGLSILIQEGGLEALRLIAGDGDCRAIKALRDACKENVQAVIDVEGDLAVMLVLMEKKLSQDAIILCLEILTILCNTSKIERQKVSESNLFLDFCLSFAFDIIKENEEAFDNDSQSVSGSSISLLRAVVSFLKSIVPIELFRKNFLKESKRHESFRRLLTKTNELEIQSLLIDFFGKMSFYTRGLVEGLFTFHDISSTFLTVLQSQRQIYQVLDMAQNSCASEDYRYHSKLITTTCCDIMVRTFLILPSNEQHDALSTLLDIFVITLKSASVQPCGLILCNMAYLFTQLTGNIHQRIQMLTVNILKTVVKIILLQPDSIHEKYCDLIDDTSKTMEEDITWWKYAQSHCLQLLSILMVDSIPSNQEGITTWGELVEYAETDLQNDGGYHDIISFVSLLNSSSFRNADSIRGFAIKKILDLLVLDNM